jgi:hypothetical protein
MPFDPNEYLKEEGGTEFDPNAYLEDEPVKKKEFTGESLQPVQEPSQSIGLSSLSEAKINVPVGERIESEPIENTKDTLDFTQYNILPNQKLTGDKLYTTNTKTGVTSFRTLPKDELEKYQQAQKQKGGFTDFVNEKIEAEKQRIAESSKKEKEPTPDDLKQRVVELDNLTVKNIDEIKNIDIQLGINQNKQKELRGASGLMFADQERNKLFAQQIALKRQRDMLVMKQQAYDTKTSEAMGLLTSKETQKLIEETNAPFWGQIINGIKTSAEDISNAMPYIKDMIDIGAMTTGAIPTDYNSLFTKMVTNRDLRKNELEKAYVGYKSTAEAQRRVERAGIDDNLPLYNFRKYAGHVFGAMALPAIASMGVTAMTGGTGLIIPLTNASIFGTMGLGSGALNTYFIARENGLNPDDSVIASERGAMIGFATQAGLGLTMGKAGKFLNNKFNTAIKPLSATVAKMGLESVGTGTEMAGAKLVENIATGMATELPISPTEGVGESFLEGMMFHGTAHFGGIPSYLKSKSLFTAVDKLSTPEQVDRMRKQIIDSNKNGLINNNQMVYLNKSIEDAITYKKIIPENVTQEELRNEFYDVLKKYEEYKELQKNSPTSLKEYYEGKMAELDVVIKNLIERSAEKAREEYEKPTTTDIQQPMGEGEDNLGAVGDVSKEGKEVSKEEVLGTPDEIKTIPTSDLNLDPNRFQYKVENREATGATGSIDKDVPFNKQLAGVVSVWLDPKDGKTYVVNGHNRTAKAKSAGVETMNVMYIDAKSPEEARAIGALQNIADGKGTAVDAAKYFRDTNSTPEDLKGQGISVKKGIGQQGLALSKLAKPLFDLVAQGRMSVERGVLIGGANSESAQKSIYEKIKQIEGSGAIKMKNSTIKEYVDAANVAPKEKVTITDLFGTTEEEQVDIDTRMELLGDIRERLIQDKNVFGVAAKKADILNEAGNQIDAAMNEGISKEAAQTLGVFDLLKNTSPELNKIINNAVKNIKDAKTRAEKTRAKNDAYEAIRNEVPRIIEGGKREGSEGVQKDKADRGQGSSDLTPKTKEEAPALSDVESTAKAFKEAGEKSRDTKDATHIGRWMLDNSQKGDVIRFQDGGYEVTEVNTKKDGTKELVLTPFEFNEDGSKDYNNTGIKIITEQSIKNSSNLFENAYTDSKGERVIEQSTYEPAKSESLLSKEQAPAQEKAPALSDVESKSILNSDVDLKGEKKEGWMMTDEEYAENEWRQLTEQQKDSKALNFAYQETVKNTGIKNPITNAEKIKFNEELEKQKLKYKRKETDWLKKAKEEYLKGRVNVTIENSLFEGRYQKAIEEGRMTANDAKAIIESAGLEVPKDIESLLSKEQTPKTQNDFQYVIDKANKAGGGVKGSGTKKINLSDRETAILNKTIEKLEAKAVANNGASFDPNETINIQYEKINGKEQKVNTYTVDGYSIKYKYNGGKSMTEITTPQGDLLIVSKQYGKTEIAYLGKSESLLSKEQAPVSEPTPTQKLISDAMGIFYELKDGKKSSTERRILKEKMNEMLSKSPKIKYIFDNIQDINKELGDNIKKRGDC